MDGRFQENTRKYSDLITLLNYVRVELDVERED